MNVPWLHAWAPRLGADARAANANEATTAMRNTPPPLRSNQRARVLSLT
jgi:hypothetical protein